jgi:molybdate transport system regulatory protein
VTGARLTLYLGPARHKLGPGKIRLLEAIRDEGSISAAARAMKMAYRHAWELVDELNACFAEPLVEASAGGREGGGSTLTPRGEELIRRFHSMEAASRSAIRKDLDALDEQLSTPRRA